MSIDISQINQTKIIKENNIGIEIISINQSTKNTILIVSFLVITVIIISIIFFIVVKDDQKYNDNTFNLIVRKSKKRK